MSKVKVNSINSNFNSNKNNLTPKKSPNFTGTILMKGVWPAGIEGKFIANNAVTKAIKKYSITAEMFEKERVEYKFAKNMRKYAVNHRPVYRLKVSVKKDKPTFWDKIKYALGLQPKTYMSKYYHSAATTDVYLDQRLGAVFYRLTE